MVLIPLLLDDPLWDIMIHQLVFSIPVLIPLLLDDPLWDHLNFSNMKLSAKSLNPSFAG